MFFYPRANPLEVAVGGMLGGAGPQLAAQSKDDRDIVLNLSVHPKHDEVLYCLTGESHTGRTLEVFLYF